MPFNIPTITKMKIKNIRQLKKLIKDPNVEEDLKRNPVDFINSIKTPPLTSAILTTVVWMLGIVLIVVVVQVFVVSWLPSYTISVNNNDVQIDREVSEFFIMVGSAAVGALAGIVVPKGDE